MRSNMWLAANRKARGTWAKSEARCAGHPASLCIYQAGCTKSLGTTQNCPRHSEKCSK